MNILSDLIEEYLLRLLSLSPREHLDIQRGELAEKFNCVPSQINYVLSTRFTPERGYLVESRRGGGGFIRIVRMSSKLRFLGDSFFNADDGLDIRQARDLLKRFYEEKLISRREVRIMDSALTEINKELCIDEIKNRKIIKRLFNSMLLAVLKES